MEIAIVIITTHERVYYRDCPAPEVNRNVNVWAGLEAYDLTDTKRRLIDAKDA